MPYIPLPIGDHVPEPLRALIASVVDGALKEIRCIMEIDPPADAGPKGHLQLSLAKLLLSAVDGAAQLLPAGGNGKWRSVQELSHGQLSMGPRRLRPRVGR